MLSFLKLAARKVHLRPEVHIFQQCFGHVFCVVKLDPFSQNVCVN